MSTSVQKSILRGFALTTLASLLIVIQAVSSQAQWATNGTNIHNTNTGRVGIGTETPASIFSINQSNADHANVGGAGSHLLITNPSATGQNVVASMINGAMVGKWRTDYLSNVYWVAGNANANGNHIFYVGGDYPNGSARMVIHHTGNIGIGTPSPAAPLHVLADKGNVLLGNISSGFGAIGFQTTLGLNNFALTGNASETVLNTPAGTSLSLRVNNNPHKGLVLHSSNNVGIGTSTPATPLHVLSNNANVLLGNISSNYGAIGFQNTLGLNNFALTGSAAETVLNTPAGTSLNLRVNNNPNDGLVLHSSNNVGIGTSAPATKLHVVGDIRVDGNINAKYQDVAEWVPSKQKLDAGTVVILDIAHNNHVAASATPYDTRVAGVVSAQPGISLGEQGEGKALVATTGRVKVRVDATRGAIRVGDLLVTSETAGVAMRSQPLDLGGVPIHRPGTLIGKALESLDKGAGEILVLLSLQ